MELTMPASTLVLLAISALVGAASPTTLSPSQLIIARALQPSPLEEDLRRLSDEIGGRVTGTAEMARAVTWAVTAFRDAGVNVHTENYTIPLTWREGQTRLELSGPVRFPVSLVAEGWSLPTPAEGIEAAIEYGGDGTDDDFARLGERVGGAILLFNSAVSVTWSDLFIEYDRPNAIVDRAIARGARAILWTSTRERRTRDRHNDTVDGELSRLPMATVVRDDALRLARTIAAHPGSVRARLQMPNVVGGPAQEQNVIGEIRGRELPEETVLLGAHLDSWDLGTGATDNGCNAAMVIAAARAIQASGVRPRRTIRFVLFSGEEQGLMGSHAYAFQHRAELDRMRAAIIFDSGCGRVTGYQVAGRTELLPGLEEALRPLTGWGVDRHTLDGDISTDNADFLLEGVPNITAIQEVGNFMRDYHADSDTFDKVDLRQLQLHVAISAVTAYGIADLKEPLGRRQSRAEIEQLLERIGLSKEMKLEGFWPSWANGTRGRELPK
jgi:carboxypeptidase Q